MSHSPASLLPLELEQLIVVVHGVFDDLLEPLTLNPRKTEWGEANLLSCWLIRSPSDPGTNVR